MTTTAKVYRYEGNEEYAQVLCLLDASGNEHPVGGMVFATSVAGSGSADTIQHVTPTSGLPVQPQTGSSWAVTNAALTVTGGGVEASSLRVTIASDSTGLLSIDDNGSSITVDGTVAATQSGTWSITNISGTISLPTGAATADNQTTANTALAAIQAAVETLDNAISGNEIQADVLSVIPGTAATSLGKAEDAAHASGDVGVFMLGVRRDTPTSGADTDGDYAALSLDASGQLRTVVGNTVTVTGTVTAAQATAANLNMTEANSAAIAASLGVLDDWDESDRAKVNLIAGQAGITAGAGSVGASTPRVTLASNDPAVVALTTLDDVVKLSGGLTVGDLHMYAIGGYESATARAWAMNSSGHGFVVNGGTFAVQVDGSALTALQLIDDCIFTDDAAFTPGTSKVAVIGAQCDDDSTDLVDEGDAGALRMTKERKLRSVAALDSAAMQSGNDEVTPKFAVINASSSGDNTIVAAVASKKLRVLSCVIVASGTVTVRFESGAAGTALTGQIDLTAQTGFSAPFSPVGHFETAANTLLNLELSGAVKAAGWLVYIEVD